MSRTIEAGAIAFKIVDKGALILIVRAKKTPGDWIFPKGHIEDGETPAEAAVREAREEAGVVGRALRSVGTLEVDVGDYSVDVEYFLVALEKDSGESDEGRKRKWCTRDEAIDRVDFDESRELIKRAWARLPANGTRGSKKTRN